MDQYFAERFVDWRQFVFQQLAFDHNFEGIGICLPLAFTSTGFNPKLVCQDKRFDVKRLPPANFVAGLMELAMMSTAKRDGEFIANFHTQCAWLRKT